MQNAVLFQFFRCVLDINLANSTHLLKDTQDEKNLFCKVQKVQVPNISQKWLKQINTGKGVTLSLFSEVNMIQKILIKKPVKQS